VQHFIALPLVVSGQTCILRLCVVSHFCTLNTARLGRTYYPNPLDAFTFSSYFTK
jgi:hypothetical protein